MVPSKNISNVDEAPAALDPDFSSYSLQRKSQTILPIHAEIDCSRLALPIELRASLLSPFTWSVTSLPWPVRLSEPLRLIATTQGMMTAICKTGALLSIAPEGSTRARSLLPMQIKLGAPSQRKYRTSSRQSHRRLSLLPQRSQSLTMTLGNWYTSHACLPTPAIHLRCLKPRLRRACC